MMGVPADQRAAMESALSAGLRRCGISVLAADAAEPALQITAIVSGGTAADSRWDRLDWEVGGASEVAGLPGSGPAQGHWLFSGSSEPADVRLERVALAMAQDAMRLWSSPRPTSIRFIRANQDQVRQIEGAFGKRVESCSQSADGTWEVNIVAPLAGDPRTAIEPLLTQAGVADRVELGKASLESVTYQFAAAAAKSPAKP